jgi:chemotaxis protein methyltransferase CheR
MAVNYEYAFTDRHFQHLRAVIHQHTGIHLAETKRELVYSRLSRRLRKLGLEAFDDYLQLLGEHDPGEFTEFVNAITTNLTAFFREPHHFDYLATTLLPELIKARQRERRLRIWSAGCSTGEEPYSIVMVLLESLPEINQWDARVLATDLDTEVIRKAMAGIYAAERVNGLSAARLKRWFQKGSGSREGLVRVAPELRRLITFKPLNLMHSWPMRGQFDLIFCRNVVIYFDKKTQRALFDRFANVLCSDGHLFIGHSESLFNLSERFESIGKTMYRRIV